MLRSVLFALLALTAIAVTPAAELTQDQQQALETKVQELRERLALTPEQEQKIAPLLEARNQKLREMRAKYGDNPSLRDERAMLREGKAIQESFDAQLRPILTAEQMSEWQKVRDEMRANARERYRNRRG